MNIFRKIFRRNARGFSLAETMVALGLMGGVSLMVAQLTKQANQVSKTAETNTSVYSVYLEMQRLLSDKASCGMTLKDLAPPTSEVVIRDKSGNPRFSEDSVYFQNTVKVKRIQLSRTGTETFVNVTLERIGVENKRGFGSAEVVKSIPVTAEYGPGNTIVACHSELINNTDEAVEKALAAMCSGVGLIYNAATQTCTTVAQLGEANIICPPGQSVVATPHSSGVSYNYECKDAYGLSGSCGLDQLLKRNSDGSFSCVSMSCPGNSIFKGITSTGEPDCHQCPSGQLPVFTTVGLTCKAISCPADKYMAGTDSEGNPICNSLVDNSVGHCSNGKLVVNADGSLRFDCCTPNCSSSALYCSGENFESPNGCGICTGTKSKDCSDSANHCSGISYSSPETCGVCVGTGGPKNATWTEWTATDAYRPKAGASCSKTCGGGVIDAERKYVRNCNNDQRCGGSPCSGDSEKWVAESQISCNMIACPSGYWTYTGAPVKDCKDNCKGTQTQVCSTGNPADCPGAPQTRTDAYCEPTNRCCTSLGYDSTGDTTVSVPSGTLMAQIGAGMNCQQDPYTSGGSFGGSFGGSGGGMEGFKTCCLPYHTVYKCSPSSSYRWVSYATGAYSYCDPWGYAPSCTYSGNQCGIANSYCYASTNEGIKKVDVGSSSYTQGYSNPDPTKIWNINCFSTLPVGDNVPTGGYGW